MSARDRDEEAIFRRGFRAGAEATRATFARTVRDIPLTDGAAETRAWLAHASAIRAFRRIRKDRR